MGKGSAAFIPMRVVEKIIDTISVIMFVIIFIAAMAQIILRWIFRDPLIWSEELIRLMFVWICFLGWTMGTRHNTHIQISAIISKLSPLGHKIMQTFNCSIIIVFSALMVVYGIQMAAASAMMKAVSMQFINFAMVYGICPFANAVIIAYQVIRLANLWVTSSSGVQPELKSARGKK